MREQQQQQGEALPETHTEEEQVGGAAEKGTGKKSPSRLKRLEETE